MLNYLDSAEQVLGHPRHQDAQRTVAELIGQLRACQNVKDGYEFQQALLAQVLAVETARNEFSRAVKRMAGGKAPQSGAPELQSGLDSSLRETWQLERAVAAARQAAYGRHRDGRPHPPRRRSLVR